MTGSTVPYQHVGEALATDYSLVREQFTDEEWDHFLYTKGDGVVRSERAIVEEADCVEVEGNHIGLIANRSAYRAIATALARPELPVADAQ